MRMAEGNGRSDGDAESRRTERKITIPDAIWDECKIAAIRQKVKGGAGAFVLRAIRHELYGRAPGQLEPAAEGAHGALPAPLRPNGRHS